MQTIRPLLPIVLAASVIAGCRGGVDPRIVDGDANGDAGVDMGAYEYQP